MDRVQELSPSPNAHALRLITFPRAIIPLAVGVVPSHDAVVFLSAGHMSLSPFMIALCASRPIPFRAFSAFPPSRPITRSSKLSCTACYSSRKCGSSKFALPPLAFSHMLCFFCAIFVFFCFFWRYFLFCPLITSLSWCFTPGCTVVSNSLQVSPCTLRLCDYNGPFSSGLLTNQKTPSSPHSYSPPHISSEFHKIRAVICFYRFDWSLAASRQRYQPPFRFTLRIKDQPPPRTFRSISRFCSTLPSSQSLSGSLDRLDSPPFLHAPLFRIVLPLPIRFLCLASRFFWIAAATMIKHLERHPVLTFSTAFSCVSTYESPPHPRSTQCVRRALFVFRTSPGPVSVFTLLPRIHFIPRPVLLVPPRLCETKKSLF